MTQFAFSVPDDLAAWAEARAVAARLNSAGEYLAELLRQDREHVEKLSRLQAAIDEGLASPIVDATMDDVIRRGKARHGLA